ncbi:MAG TPA: hypothetical protein VJB61_22650, partial [Actinomycetota bacterium]
MRSVRILLVALALVAVGLAGWALGARDDYGQPAAAPAATEATPQATTPAAQGQTPPGATSPSGGGTTPATRAALRPSIVGFGSEPVYPQKGGFWQLPAGPGEAVLITDAQHATKVEFLLTP